MDIPRHRKKEENDKAQRRTISSATHTANNPTPESASSGMGRSSSDKHGHPPTNRPTSSERWRTNTSGSYTGYRRDPAGAYAQDSTMQYQSAYEQGTRQSQGFPGYGANVMYPVTQAGSQSPYDAQQFHGRQGAALPVLASDTSTYFSTADSSTAGSSGLQSSNQTSSATGYQSFSGFSNRAPSTGDFQGARGADLLAEEQDYAMSVRGEQWREYHSKIQEVFRYIQSDSLSRAGEILLRLSHWLLSQVVDLGLQMDNQRLHAERLKMWADFNHAWLALFQRQKDLGEGGQRFPNMISRQDLEKMGRDLVRLCDGVERHGLVDYEYGVWEEQIIAILTECIDLAESMERHKS